MADEKMTGRKLSVPTETRPAVELTDEEKHALNVVFALVMRLTTEKARRTAKNYHSYFLEKTDGWGLEVSVVKPGGRSPVEFAQAGEVPPTVESVVYERPAK